MKNTSPTLIAARAGCSLGTLLFALIIATVLFKLRPETETKDPVEPVLAVNLRKATLTNLAVEIETQGIAKPLRKVMLSTQVGGRVIEMPIDLKSGDLVQKDQLLFKIDPIDYQTTLAEAKASVSRLEASLELIQVNQAADKKQLTLSERSRDLALQDYERSKTLSENGQAVSIAVVESAERTYTQAESQVLQLQQSLAQVPGRRQELESELQAAKTRVTQSQLQLDRTEIRAPFNARVQAVMVEKDEVLQSGNVVYELADDSRLEIAVPVSASDLRDWIPFESARSSDQGWFPPLQKVPVTIRWSESSRDIEWQGTLDRMIRFDATTRTAMLAVRVNNNSAQTQENNFPLAEGMFCQVVIPGNELQNVIKVPRSAVTFDNHCFLNVDGRLKTVPVSVARSQGDFAYISEGISPGDQMVTTRLVAPLEGSKLIDAGAE